LIHCFSSNIEDSAGILTSQMFQKAWRLLFDIWNFMDFIDTHCHLDSNVFDKDRGEILQKCQTINISKLILPGVDRMGWQGLVDLCNHESGLYAALGLHPCFLDDLKTDDFAVLEKLVAEHQDRVLAIGETGLDFFIKNYNETKQTECFEKQVKIAKKMERPLILHVRKAHDQVAKILRKNSFTHKGIVHCYSGSKQQAKKYLELGFKLGIGGVITYDRSHRLQRIVSDLPLTCFVLETDAPDIPVCGKEGHRNSPEYIPEIFQSFVKYRTESAEEINKQLYLNTIDLFPHLKG